ncbi:synaptotagmin-like protein 5 isoform X2 [Ptychodera flava]|uniref:synaptotagmin-like protein 5 isoform X2 n=1 Tax=Ptychodera flava TaxID=63121 RepID=UPI00396A4082
MMDLSHLTDEEKKKILEVLQRDEVLRKEEENRVRKLRIQLQELRQKGVIKSDSGDSGKTCARCRESLGLIFNTGETCPKCQHKVCKRCKVNRQSWDKSWLCIICDKQRDIKGKTGDWFYEKVPQVNKIKLFGSEVIQTSINKNSLAQGYSSLVSSEEQREFQKTQQNLTNAPTGETVIDNGSLSSSLLKSSHENSSFGAYGKAKGNTESENNSIVSESSGYYDRSLQEHSHPNEHCTPESQSKFEHYRVHELKRHSSLDTDYSSSQSSLRNYNNRMDSPTTVSLTASDTAHRVKNGHDLYDNLSDIGGDSLHDSDIHSSCTSNAILHTTRGPGDGADSEKDKQSSHLVSDLSDSEPEAITEAMTGVAFHRMTLKSQQRSPLHVSGDNNDPLHRSIESLHSSQQNGQSIASLSQELKSSSATIHSVALSSNNHPICPKHFHDNLSCNISEASAALPHKKNLDSSGYETFENDRSSLQLQESRTEEIPFNADSKSSFKEQTESKETTEQKNKIQPEQTTIDKTKNKKRLPLFRKRESRKIKTEQINNQADIFDGMFVKAMNSPPTYPMAVDRGHGQSLKTTKEEDDDKISFDKSLTVSDLLNYDLSGRALDSYKVMSYDSKSSGVSVSSMKSEPKCNEHQRNTEAPFEHDSLAGRGDYSHHKDKLGEKRPLTLLEIAQSRSYSKRKESNGSAPVVEVDSVSDSTGENEDIDKHFRSHSKSATSSPVMMSNLSATTSGSVDSLTSFYSSAGERNLGKITITGDVKFDMTYNYKTGIFEVKIIACRDLAPVDTRKNFSDPYVKLYLLPDKTKNGKRKTKVKKHTLNPHYDEVLKYVISESELQTRTLWISAWHNDAFGHNDFLGEIQLPLDDINFEEFHATWRPLSPRAAGAESTLSYKGDLSLALRFVYPEIPTSGSPPNNIPRQTIGRKKKPKGSGDGMQGVLHVHFKGAKNLIAVRINGYSDPFAKCYLLPNRSRAGKRKTEVLRKNCNPQWNQMFVYEGLTLEDLKERALEITLWDRESVTSNDFLGGLRLGIGSGKSYSKEVKWQDSRLEEIDLWKRMLECPNKWVDGDISLRSHMNGKEAKEPHYV